MIRSKLARATIAGIRGRIKTAEGGKGSIIELKNLLKKSYQNKEISWEEYGREYHKEQNGRSPDEWIEYYDSYIAYCQGEIKAQGKHLTNNKILLAFFSVVMILTLSLSIIFIGPTFAGLLVQETESENSAEEVAVAVEEKPQNSDEETLPENTPPVEEVGSSIITSGIVETPKDVVEETQASENASEESVEENVPVENVTEKISSNENETVVGTNESGVVEIPATSEEVVEESAPMNNVSDAPAEEILNQNITGVLDEIFIETTQLPAILGQPVKWKKKISLLEPKKIRVLIPTGATKISVNKKGRIKKADFIITGDVILEDIDSSFIKRFFMKLIRAFTGRVVQEIGQGIEIDDDATEYEIEYETPAPYAVDEPTDKAKRVKIVGPEDIHYENVLAFTDLGNTINVRTPSRVRIYWVEESKFLPVESIKDLDDNGVYDYVSWIIPRMSNQTFEIVITAAEHLNKKKEFVSDIYEEVNETDGVTYTIPKDHYARAYFERNLTNKNMIDIVVHNTKPVTIEIYEKDSDIVVGRMDNVLEGVYFFELNFSGNQDVFDLKSVGGKVVYDYIHDAAGTVTFDNVNPNQTSVDNGARIEVNVAATCDGTQDNYVIWVTDDANQIGGSCSGASFTWVSVTINTCEAAGGCLDNGDGTVTATRCKTDALDFTYVIEACSVDAVNTINADQSGGNDNPDSSPTDVEILEVVDNTDPYFTAIPTDASVDYLAGVGVEFDATDAVSFDTFSVNDSDFSINSTGRLINSVELAGGTYAVNISISDSAGNTNFTSYGITVNTIDPGLSFAVTPSNTEDYLVTTTATGSGCPAQLTCNLYREGASVTNGESYALAAGTYNYTYNTTGNVNYTSGQVSDELTVNKISPTASLTNNETWTEGFGIPVIIGYSESNAGDGDITYTVKRDAVSVGSGETVALGGGSYDYTIDTDAGQNYSAAVGLDPQTLAVNPIASEVNLTLNNSRSNVTIEGGSSIDLNCSTLAGESAGFVDIYREGTSINNATSLVGNYTTFSTAQIENITCYYLGSQNYSVSIETWFVNVTSGDEPPVVYDVWNESMTDISSGPDENTATYIIVNFSVSDANGYANLNDATAKINFTKGAETRSTSCTQYQGAGDYANYTCNVTMWWFDGAGDWSINASIEDDESNLVANATDIFAVGTTAGFESSISELTWGAIAPGSSSIEPSDNVIMNNTGNLIRSVDINATNLYGESNAGQALWAANFTAHTAASCGGTAMVAQTFTAVSGASLPIGNYTLNDGTGQEDIFFCLEAANSVLDAQVYSTTAAGTWTIRIFMVLLTPRRKRRTLKPRKKTLNTLDLTLENLKEEGMFSKEELTQLLLDKIESQYEPKMRGIVPLEIFSNKLGALESLTKYLRENLEMKYSKIATKLKRDERTIWTSYKKAIGKLEKRFKIKDIKLSIPLSEFKKDSLTVLERVVVYLKDKKDKKYSEIARIIGRDQRNVWSVYSKASSKLN